MNWSGTHRASVRGAYHPESEAEVAAVVAMHHRAGVPLRPIGSAISPNGLGFPPEHGSSLNLGLMDRLLSVDREAGTATVQAGARVSAVVEALRPHGLTLENYASIAEQQIGGFTQVSAHGTGARVPPVDDQVLALTLVTGTGAVLRLRADAADEGERDLFLLARAGLGALGVVTELTLRVKPRHRLRERTWTMSRAEASDPAAHAGRVRGHRHVRYMWIPFTDTVVVVACDPVGVVDPAGGGAVVPVGSLGDGMDAGRSPPGGDDGAATVAVGTGAAEAEAWAKLPILQLLRERHAAARRAGAAGGADPPCEGGGGETVRARALRAVEEEGDAASLSMAGIRDLLLGLGPLDPELAVAAAHAEAEYWTKAAGPGGRVREGWSDEILGFDCGGAQWVSEVAMPAGTLEAPSGAGNDFVLRVLRLAEGGGPDGVVAAHSPIEQRWTAASASPMSPANEQRWRATSIEDGGGGGGGGTPLFSWVGIIQYMPLTDCGAQREAVTRDFRDRYEFACKRDFWGRFRAVPHWAKLEPAVGGAAELERDAAMLEGAYDLDTFRQVHAVMDPAGIFVGPALETLGLAGARGAQPNAGAERA